MPDYGHPLRFGTFITPGAARPETAVDLAVLSEQLGFDLVTFQDHPYQPAFLDTWTLLTWVAARTERIHLSGNVLNVPLRQPAVLARATASLDLLSGGRVDLALGAGGFWDAIVAMGEERRTPGESIRALGEAVEVIRGIWDTADRGTLHAGGDLHRVDGAKRGPAPAHDIPIWLGVLGPRALRLLGRIGDGWLPSLFYLEPGQLQAGNRAIDASATEAGRDPREITRLLNVGPQTGPEELARYALEDGVSTFILASDDPRTLQDWSERVLPEVRSAVDAGRGERGTETGARIRNSIALGKRMPGIDYDGVPESLRERAVEPGDRAWARYTSTYLRGGAPGLVLRPRDVSEVQEAVRFASAHRELPLGILSAGHGLSGRSINTGGLVIDVGALDRIELLDAETGRVRIGPGATWVEVARALTPHGLAISSGDYGRVGVGGLATAGGIGWLARQHGLTIDHLRSVDVVLADGTLVHADDEHEPDLFWAVRGAGANFGIVVDFEFEAARVGEVAFVQFAFDATDASGLIERFGAAMEAADRRVSGEIILGGGRGRLVARAMLVVDASDPDTILTDLEPLASIAPLLEQQVSLARYDQVMEMNLGDEGQHGRGEPHSHSALVEHLTPEFAAESERMLIAGASYFYAIRAVGGAVSDVPADATAYAGRSARFSLAAFGSPASGFEEWWARILQHTEGMYLSFESAQGDDVVARAFPPRTLARLRALKARFDPTSLFRDNFPVAPEQLPDAGAGRPAA